MTDLLEVSSDKGANLVFFLTTTPLRDFLLAVALGGWGGTFGFEIFPEPGIGGGLFRLLARAATALEDG